LDLQIKIVCAHQQIFLQRSEFLASWHLDEDREREILMHHRLSYIDHANFAGGERFSQ